MVKALAGPINEGQVIINWNQTILSAKSVGSPGGLSPGALQLSSTAQQLHTTNTPSFFKYTPVLYPRSGWWLLQSSRNRCLAALREELTLYETFPKWAHLPRSATRQKPQSASGLHSPDLSIPPHPNPSHLNSNPLVEPTP